MDLEWVIMFLKNMNRITKMLNQEENKLVKK